jgi:hypothetical protein
MRAARRLCDQTRRGGDERVALSDGGSITRSAAIVAPVHRPSDCVGLRFRRCGADEALGEGAEYSELLLIVLSELGR